MRLLIQGAKLIDPIENSVRQGDLLVEDGIIRAVGEHLQSENALTLDANGYTLAPGLVDAHVHLRDPGQTHKEDFESGCAAAAAGGFTSIAAMPNTSPVMDQAALLAETLSRANRQGRPHVLQVAAVTKGLLGQELTDFQALSASGAIAFSDDGRPVLTAPVMEQALRLAAALGKPLLSHAEELSLPGIDPASESVAVARDICLAEQTGCPVHFCHISTAASVRLIRDAKRAGIPVTAETAPHYFTLTRECLGTPPDPNAKMNPPLRGEADRKAVREALADGTIDLIATDHAPHAPEEKAQPFDKAPNGVIGLETSLALGLTELVRGGVLTLPELLCKMSAAPARLLGLPCGKLSAGSPADLVLFDEERRWTVRPEALHSRSRNTPFSGRELCGAVLLTLVGGAVAWCSEELKSNSPALRALCGV